jgi:hypothetical protein
LISIVVETDKNSDRGNFPAKSKVKKFDCFLIHVLPKGFHRIRHYGLLASSNRAETIARARELLGVVTSTADASTKAQQSVETDPPTQALAHPCPCCRGRMFIIETFEAGCKPRHRPAAPLGAIRIDTS